jgi:L-lactate dehydrogenase (cytochrome)
MGPHELTRRGDAVATKIQGLTTVKAEHDAKRPKPLGLRGLLPLLRFSPPKLRASIDDALSLEDLRHIARRRIPRALYDLIEGGADDEVSVGRNRSAFGAVALLPRVLVDVGEISLRTTVLGAEIDLPVILSPTGGTRNFHHEGELAVARAAAGAGTIYNLSSVSTTSLEEVAKETAGPKWFQLSMYRDVGLRRELIQRARAAGYEALCLTVDAPVVGNRERDRRNGMSMPPSIGLRTIVDASRRFEWWWNFVRSEPLGLPNISGTTGDTHRREIGKFSDLFDPSVTWEDLDWMLSEWNGPVLIKGINSADDAARAVEAGVRGIVVSNHGGRQLDETPGMFSLIAPIVDRLGGSADVILDGGVRRGTDVIKALAAGATCCMLGRPYVYALAAGGQAGVDRMFSILRDELILDLRLLGCADVRQLDRSFLVPTRT